VAIDSLEGDYQKAYLCCPNVEDKKWPLMVYQHGDGGGGASLKPGYSKLIGKMVNEGFCVAAPYSCALDLHCDNGQTSYLEVLKTLVHFDEHSMDFPMIDQDLGFSVAGHSTGGRVALMLAALKDTMDDEVPYLSTVPQGEGLTTSMKFVLRKINAFTGDHSDPMSDPKLNPDIPNWKITKTPAFLITGSKDTLEPEKSSWENFSSVSSPTKIFVNR
jgi:pimeloyl-ACP methyl ester carboxylesterase